MTARLIAPLEYAGAQIRESKRIAWVAEALDCDESQVRELLDAGELQGHGLGKRGVRIYLDSVAAYQERRQRAPKSPIVKGSNPRPRQSPAARAAHAAAINELRRHGLA